MILSAINETWLGWHYVRSVHETSGGGAAGLPISRKELRQAARELLALYTDTVESRCQAPEREAIRSHSRRAGNELDLRWERAKMVFPALSGKIEELRHVERIIKRREAGLTFGRLFGHIAAAGWFEFLGSEELFGDFVRARYAHSMQSSQLEESHRKIAKKMLADLNIRPDQLTRGRSRIGAERLMLEFLSGRLQVFTTRAIRKHV